MNMPSTPELQAFHGFIGDKLKNGGMLSPEEALDEWRELHPEPEIDEQEVAAIQEALTDMANGDRGRPATEVLADLQAKYNLPQ